eukprot:5590758-Amphidinium_carterae.1
MSETQNMSNMFNVLGTYRGSGPNLGLKNVAKTQEIFNMFNVLGNMGHMGQEIKADPNAGHVQYVE